MPNIEKDNKVERASTQLNAALTIIQSFGLTANTLVEAQWVQVQYNDDALTIPQRNQLNSELNQIGFTDT